MNDRARAIALLTLAAVGCDGSMAEQIDGGGERCAHDVECANGLFCDGLERCAPSAPGADARGCVTGPLPCEEGRTCSESRAACETDCEVDGDFDDDGFDALICGGSDCDDADPLRNPGGSEVCDDDDRDEDCDPSTFGNRDVDGDGFVDDACCNATPDGPRCGTDCDDTNPRVHRTASEVCDGIDNDCNGLLDGPLEDVDGDGHAPPSCGGGDCAPEDPAIHPGAPEACDGLIDSNCDGAIEDADLDGQAAVEVACEGGPLPHTDCDDTRYWVLAGDREYCLAGDDDCDGSTDEVPAEDCEIVALRGGRGWSLDVHQVCAIRRGGEVDCWGTSALDPTTPGFTTAARPLGTLEGYCLRNSAEGSEPCAIEEVAPRMQALDVGPVSDLLFVPQSDSRCLRTRSGEVYCWGGAQGRVILGEHNYDPVPLPERVAGVTGAVQLAADRRGGDATCARLASGEVSCWGSGLLFDFIPERTMTMPPTRLPEHDGAVDLGSWGNPVQEIYSLDSAGVIRTRNLGSIPGMESPPEQITSDGGRHALGGTCFRAGNWIDCVNRPLGARLLTMPSGEWVLAAGSGLFVGCVIATDGRLACWGPNAYGTWGDGSINALDVRLHPTIIPGVEDVIDAYVSDEQLCALAGDGRVWCWGRNERGQLGLATTIARVTSPTEVPGLR